METVFEPNKLYRAKGSEHDRLIFHAGSMAFSTGRATIRKTWIIRGVSRGRPERLVRASRQWKLCININQKEVPMTDEGFMPFPK